MHHEKLESTVVKDVLIIAAVAVVVYVTFNFI